MSKRTLSALTCALAAALAVVVGCGGSSAKPLTKAEFIKQGDVICRKADKKKEAAIEAYVLKLGIGGKEATPAQTEYATKGVLLPPIRQETEELRELPAPEGEEEAIDKMLSGIEGAIEKSEEEAEEKADTLRHKGNPPSFHDAFANPGNVARAYGFKECYIDY